jgi:hypothetical protein
MTGLFRYYYTLNRLYSLITLVLLGVVGFYFYNIKLDEISIWKFSIIMLVPVLPLILLVSLYIINRRIIWKEILNIQNTLIYRKYEIYNPTKMHLVVAIYLDLHMILSIGLCVLVKYKLFDELFYTSGAVLIMDVLLTLNIGAWLLICNRNNILNK